MAFNFNYLSRAQDTQTYEKSHTAVSGVVTGPVCSLWMYNATSTGSNESAATIEGANYFLGAIGYMKVGDMIMVSTNDPASHILNISVNNGTTTISTAVVV